MPNLDQLIALADFASANGRRWKAALRHCWETGNYEAAPGSNFLQQLRNECGPSWLTDHKLDRNPTWGMKWCFDWFLGSSSNPTDVRSGCCGADSRSEAESMIRAACPAESRDSRLSLRIFPSRMKWPRMVS